MMYDFKTHIDRTGTGSIKTDIAPESVKDSGLVPLSVADMELPPDIDFCLRQFASVDDVNLAAAADRIGFRTSLYGHVAAGYDRKAAGFCNA